MKHITITTLLIASVAGLSGCSSLGDAFTEMETNSRNHILAQKAWGHWSWVYDDLEHPIHFSRGFKAGYRNILDGGNGCQPALPPKIYWKPAFQTPVGKLKTYHWFDGFSHGALAAKQDGYDGIGSIPISPRVRQNLMMSRKRPEDNMLFYGMDEDTDDDTAVDGIERGDVQQLIPRPDGVGNDLTPVEIPPVNTRPYDE